MIKYLADAHETIAERGGVIIRATSAEGGSKVHHASISGHQEAPEKTRFSGGNNVRCSEGEESLMSYVRGMGVGASSQGLSTVAESVTTTAANSSTADAEDNA